MSSGVGDGPSSDLGDEPEQPHVVEVLVDEAFRQMGDFGADRQLAYRIDIVLAADDIGVTRIEPAEHVQDRQRRVLALRFRSRR